MKRVCETCSHVHPSNAARRADRFGVSGVVPTYYAEYPDSPLRFTRAAAEADWCAWKVRTR